MTIQYDINHSIDEYNWVNSYLKNLSKFYDLSYIKRFFNLYFTSLLNE